MTPAEMRRHLDRLAQRTIPPSVPDMRPELIARLNLAVEAHRRAGGWDAHHPAELVDGYSDALARLTDDLAELRASRSEPMTMRQHEQLADREHVLAMLADLIARALSRAHHDLAAGRPVADTSWPLSRPDNMSVIELVTLAET